jgi:predicted sulfurtransferase
VLHIDLDFCYIRRMRRLSLQLLVWVWAMLMLFACATPQPPQRSTGNLSAEQLKALVDSKAPMTLVDTRTEYEFRKGHIPGAINIPPHKFPVLDTLLPPDKSAHVIFYCRGAA